MTQDYAPGTSPFHTKGVLYLGTMAFFAEKSPAGMSIVHEQISDPALLAFIQQRFLAGSWYDALPAAPLIRAEARALKMTVDDYMHVRTVWQAKSDFNGIYRALLKYTSPKSLVDRFPRVVQRYYDFATLTTLGLDDRRVQLLCEGVPAPLAFWLSSVFGTYARTIVSFCGAALPSARVFGLRVEGEKYGVELSRFIVELTWGA
jgi:hypothetical protein